MPGLILLIDDEEIIRITSGEILNELGYEVICASSGDEGMNILRGKEGKISLVILDMSMPGKSGFDVYREIKNEFPAVKVLLTSGYKEDDKIENAIHANSDGFIQKPYTLDELDSRISSIIQ